MNNILLIGGTDPSGAGLQTDWLVANQLQVPANSVVTAVTSQNSEDVFDQGILPYQQIKSQLKMLEGIPFAAIKIGMLGNESVVKVVVDFIRTHASNTPVILDPVLESSSGGALINHKGFKALLKDLLPLATLVTPNNHELSALTGITINTNADRESAARNLLDRGAKTVLVKGGHFQTDKNHSIDYFAGFTPTESSFYLKGQRWQERQNVRGTGCAFASAVACSLSKGYSLTDAVVFAKAFISSGIRQAKESNQSLRLSFANQSKVNPFDLEDFPELHKNQGELERVRSFPSCNTKKLGIYPVVDSFDWIKKLVPLGIKTIQLRIKDKPPEAVENELSDAIEYAKKHQIRLFINDYWQLAVKHKAYGIHLGQEDLDQLDSDDLDKIAEAGCRLGISTHCYSEVARAHAIKPSYLALGPIFATTSKDMPWIPQGVPAVHNWVDLLGDEYPLVAIGGINYARAEALKETGIGSVAMITAITEAPDYQEVTRSLIKLFED